MYQKKLSKVWQPVRIQYIYFKNYYVYNLQD